MTDKLRIIFMGTPDFSVAPLRALIESGHDVVCVYSQPPRPKGRGQQVQPSPVHDYAADKGIEVRAPINFKDPADVQDFAALKADVAVVVAYGLILPKSILAAPQYGCLNIHASLLPRWRGAAPIHRAVLAGDAESGITIMQMDEGLDTGYMIAIERTPITPKTTSAVLHDTLSDMGARMIVDVINALARDGTVEATPQPDDGVTYANKLDKLEGRIDWSDEAAELDRRIRAFTPWPGTWTMDSEGKRLKIISAVPTSERSDADEGTILEGGRVVCGDETVLQLTSVQPEGKKPMDIAAAINGGYLKAGSVLS